MNNDTRKSQYLGLVFARLCGSRLIVPIADQIAIQRIDICDNTVSTVLASIQWHKDALDVEWTTDPLTRRPNATRAQATDIWRAMFS